MIITIDGPAASGKSTIARNLAKKLNFLHFNSGSLFRAVTCYLYFSNFDFNSLTKDTTFNNIKIAVEYINNEQHVFINDVDYFKNLRDNQISILTPIASSNSYIRNIIDNFQRDYCKNHNVVVEGRDAGSYVFPNADLKIYLDCNIKVRAERRYAQIEDKSSITLEEIEKQILERDEFDKNKEIAPFIIPNGAKIVDSTNLNVEQTINKILEFIK